MTLHQVPDPPLTPEVARQVINTLEEALGKINRRAKTDTYCTARDLGHMAATALRLAQRQKDNR